jgi:GT2 family glycosyltransferase
MISVLVPSFRDDVLVRLLTNMERREAMSTELVIVLDNGLDPATLEAWPKVRSITVPHEPFVFSQAFNMGVAAAPAHHDIVALGDDVEILTDHWASRMLWRLAQWPAAYGLLACAETTTASVYGRYPDTSDIIDLPDVALGAGIMIPRPILDLVGPWDETLVGYGFDDFDYGVRLLHVGCRLGITGVVMLENSRQASGWQRRLGSYEAVVAKGDVNFQIFHEKWYGRVPEKPWVIKRPTVADHFLRQACLCSNAAAVELDP